MKEIIAVIRREKVNETKSALAGIGFNALTIDSVLGRGKQKGYITEVDPLMAGFESAVGSVHEFIPKRVISLVVDDEEVEAVVKSIIKVNQTGNYGDGKVFVCPISASVRIRTGEEGTSALH